MSDRPSDPPSGNEQPPRPQLTVKGMAWNTKFPPAAWFEEFDAVTKDGGKLLFKSYLAETEHRRLLESRAQSYPFIVDLVARGCATLVAVVILGVAVVAIFQQAYWLAALFGGGVIAAVITAFLRR